MSYNYEETAEYDTALEYETTTPYTESTGDKQPSTPFNNMELETVQNATIGSGAVPYTATSQPTSTDTESTEELCRDFIHGNCERVNCRYKHDITEREKSTQQVQSSNTSQEVCRDFMHGHCNRAGCKFKHDTTERDNDRVNQPICKDYQKSGCHRAKCRYLHLSEAEEAEFSKTGKMPTVSNANAASEKPELCRDFTNGNCNRGVSCRYSHGDNNNTTLNLLFPAPGKRPFSSLTSLTSLGGSEIGMKDENEQLKTKLLDLRKQVMELTQLNDALYTENMKFRKELGGGVVADVSKIALLPSPIFSK